MLESLTFKNGLTHTTLLEGLVAGLEVTVLLFMSKILDDFQALSLSSKHLIIISNAIPLMSPCRASSMAHYDFLNVTDLLQLFKKVPLYCIDD
jgi:hypothetical protein